MLKKPGARSISVFSRVDAQQLFQRARTIIRQNGLEIRCAPKSLDYGRVLIIIPRTVGNAVTRNLIRRRLKSIFFENSFYERNFDCIILVKKAASTLSFDELKRIVFKAYEPSETP
jgi:ribonuclease P protein component